MRDRKWVYLDPEGVKLEQDSGLYRTGSELYENRQRKFLVELLRDRRHGQWMSWWSNGAPQLTGRWAHGAREGRWVLHLPDGSIEAAYFTGVYRDGELAPGAVPPPDPFEIPEERAAAEADPVQEWELAPLPRPAWVELQQRRAHVKWIEKYLEHPDPMERAKAEHILVQYGRDAVPDLINRMAGADAEDPEPARRLHALLRAICRGREFPWPADDPDPALARRTLLRWYAWWEVCGLDDGWWAGVAAGTAPDQLLCAEVFDGAPPPAAARVASRGGDTEELELELVSSDLFRARARARRGREADLAIERGLDWLARHQSPDGGWRASAFGVQCQRAGQPECEGPGSSVNDVGVTGLALLAFLAEGDTTGSGDHPRVVEAAIRWLISRQDPQTGLFGERLGYSFVYNHAIATTALAEVAHFTESSLVRDAVARASELILESRNPNMAWRYEMPANGENDTSVTGWMVHALYAAVSAGIELDPERLESAHAGALRWFESVTSEQNGRVGYDARGGVSARVSNVNDHFPPERGEAMTAVGLFSRYLLGQAPSSEPAMSGQAELILAKPPVWAPESFDCDVYYWYHGTNAMAQVGGRSWERWNRALVEAATKSQADSRGSCLRGSWDPVGPWGHAGGRVYGTALLVLCLQGEFRYPRGGR